MLLLSIFALSTHINFSLTGFLDIYFKTTFFVFLFKITLKQRSFLLTSGLRITMYGTLDENKASLKCGQNNIFDNYYFLKESSMSAFSGASLMLFSIIPCPTDTQ